MLSERSASNSAEAMMQGGPASFAGRASWSPGFPLARVRACSASNPWLPPTRLASSQPSPATLILLVLSRMGRPVPLLSAAGHPSTWAEAPSHWPGARSPGEVTARRPRNSLSSNSSRRSTALNSPAGARGGVLVRGRSANLQFERKRAPPPSQLSTTFLRLWQNHRFLAKMLRPTEAIGSERGPPAARSSPRKKAERPPGAGELDGPELNALLCVPRE